MDQQRFLVGLSREGAVREGGLEGSGPEEKRRTHSSSGATGEGLTEEEGSVQKHSLEVSPPL